MLEVRLPRPHPPQVAKRMLAGDTQIVYNVPNATVFFSDIYEFTARRGPFFFFGLKTKKCHLLHMAFTRMFINSCLVLLFLVFIVFFVFFLP
jgi:hypothetical protein